MKTENFSRFRFSTFAIAGKSWFIRPAIAAHFLIGILGIAPTLLIADAARAAESPTETAQLGFRFHVNALRESPFQTYSASRGDGANPADIVDNVFTTLRRIDGSEKFASIEGQSNFFVRLNRVDGAVGSRNVFLGWTATARRCAVAYNSSAAQDAARGVQGREYEVFSIVTSSASSIPRRNSTRIFCAPADARFDVTLNAASPAALPVVISTLSGTDDNNILNRFVYFIAL